MQQKNLTFDNTAAEITRLHSEILGAYETSLAKAQRIGELLAGQKARLAHGEFGPWISANLPFSDRSARNYMRLHRERDRLKTETVSDLTDAYRLLQGDSQTGRLEEQERKIEQAREGIRGAMREMVELVDEAGGNVLEGGDTEVFVEAAELAVTEDGLSEWLAKLGCPPNPALVPPQGKMWGWSIESKDKTDDLLIEPSIDEGFYFVTHMSGTPNGGFTEGTKRAMNWKGIPMFVRSVGAESIIALGEKRELDCELLDYNRWLFSSRDEWFQKVVMGTGSN